MAVPIPLRRIAGVWIQLHSFLISARDGGELLTTQPGRFTPWKEPPFTS